MRKRAGSGDNVHGSHAHQRGTTPAAHRERASRRIVRLAGVVATGLAITACATRTPEQAPAPTSLRPALIRAIATAQVMVDYGLYGPADSVLAKFALSHPGAPEAAESAFWRAFFLLDPANPNRSFASGVRVLDAYLASDERPVREVEARLLTRLGHHVDSLGAAQPAVAREEEVQKLRDELARANEELDRIKRRLATPPQ